MSTDSPINPLEPCWEQIPGEGEDTDVLVREAFWYAAALLDAGWTIQHIEARGFIGTDPDETTIGIGDCARISDELARLFIVQLAALARLDLQLLSQLDPLIKERVRTGPMSRPARFSTVAEGDVVKRLRVATLKLDFDRAHEELNQAHEGFLQELGCGREGAALAPAINDMLNVLNGFDARTADPAAVTATRALVASVVGWAVSYDIRNDPALDPQGSRARSAAGSGWPRQR